MTEETIFGEALKQTDPARRAAFLDLACAGDDALRARVEALLRSHEQAGSFLNPAPAGGATDACPPCSPDNEQLAPEEQPGSRIGPYKLVQQIGAGGMGVVWMAEQSEPVRRIVALKVIKAGMDSAQVVARFEAERQALALMDHPNIARVLDAGATQTGRPFFVMELIKGVPITRYCDERRLDLRERLALFVPVCQAVQHAHQKGVIHRDLKPSNVLVALYDGRPVPKVIDFGVAKATAQRLTERTLITGFGALVGTLEYMSPEQAELNQLDIDTRSDVYSLGVLLYELLTGSTPLDRKRLGERAVLEILLRIREEDPPTPSTRLSTSELLPTLSEQRQTEPAKLARLMRGELDWIVMRALEKDRNRRYETAAGLGQDIDRYLHDEPVQAGPPGAAYRLRKFVKRHRGAVLASVAVLLALIVGVVAASWGLVRALQAEQAARAARDAEMHQRLEAEQERTRTKLAEEDAQQKARAEQAARLRAEKGEEDARTQALEAETARHAIRMELALRAWEQNDVAEAERILDEVGKPFQNTWETRYLRGLCVRKARSLEGLFCLGLSGDGKRMLARNKESKLSLHELPTGRELFGLPAKSYRAALSKDGQRIVWLDDDGTIKGWDVTAGRELFAVKGKGAESAHNVAISNDGGRFVTGHADHTVRVCDGRTGEVLQTLRGQAQQISIVAISGDGRRVAAAAGSGSDAKVWDGVSGQLLFNLPLSSSSGAAAIALSEDGGLIVTGGVYQNVAVWDGKTGQRKAEWRGHKTAVMAVALSKDCRRIVTGGTDTDGVKVWDAQTGKELLVLRGHPSYVDRLAISDDGRRIVSSYSGLVRAWDDAATPEIQQSEAPRGLVGFVGDGEQLLFAAFQSVRIWNVAMAQDSVVFPQPGRFYVHGAAISPEGSRLALGGRDLTTLAFELKVWDVKTRRELFVCKGHRDFILSVQFSHHGKWIAAGSADGTVKLWDAATGQERLSIKQPGTHPQIAITPDDKRIIAVGREQPGKVWDATSGQEVMTLEGTPGLGVTGLAISCDGRWLAGGAWDKTVRVWDLRTGAQKFCIKGHHDSVWGAAFSPDGTRLVSCSQDRTVKMWDTTTGQLMLTFKVSSPTFKGHFRDKQNVAFSPDGARLAWASWDYDENPGRVESMVRLWEAP